MKDMTSLEYQHFMLDRARTAKLATVTADGHPHVAPIWFDLDGETLVFNTGETTLKGKNIRRDGHVSICVDDDTPPFAFVIITGMAKITTPTPEELVYWATRIAGRYMGPTLAEAYGKRNGVAGELLIRVTPSKVLAKNGVSD
jgi:hypothetical protein